MKKIIVTVGISNSGKSTWAHEQWAETPEKYIIVNRDKIRELLFGFTEPTIYKYYHTAKIRDFEKEVTRYEDTLINEALKSGKIPLVDATHLSRKYLERFKYWNTEVELKIFPVMLKVAQIRNVGRERQVSNEIMQKQYNKFVGLMEDLEKNPIDFTPVEFVNDPSKPPCVVFDVDNTLAIRGDRSPYAWLEVGKDKLDKPTALLSDYLNSSEHNPKIIICTGRDGESLDETQKWLDVNNIGYDEIYIRRRGDMRSDDIIKEEIWRDIATRNYIVMLVDDRNSVVRRGRALGLKVAQVEYGNF
jgi:predicted kinase